jgi:hypothetical protein
MTSGGEYSIEVRDDGARLGGVMRLVSPSAYRAELAPVSDKVGQRAGQPFVLDVADLQFLNSSGITALSRLVLRARGLKVGLSFIIDDSVLWQKKTLPSLAKLYPGMKLQSR